MFDKTLTGMAIMFAVAGVVSYWLPGSNPDGFELIKMGFISAVSFYLGKKSSTEG